MQCPKRVAFLFVFGALVLAIPTLAGAQPYVYPARGKAPATGVRPGPVL
jgi:hypothetical protein